MGHPQQPMRDSIHPVPISFLGGEAPQSWMAGKGTRYKAVLTAGGI
jgi:hypothetical protein